MTLDGDDEHAAISIHAPREGCDPLAETYTFANPISIHAPREGCDITRWRQTMSYKAFQSTHPVRGATSMDGVRPCIRGNFNPRTP